MRGRGGGERKGGEEGGEEGGRAYIPVDHLGTPGCPALLLTVV